MDIFASSGGAVNALAPVARHPCLVRTLFIDDDRVELLLRT